MAVDEEPSMDFGRFSAQPAGLSHMLDKSPACLKGFRPELEEGLRGLDGGGWDICSIHRSVLLVETMLLSSGNCLMLGLKTCSKVFGA